MYQSRDDTNGFADLWSDFKMQYGDSRLNVSQ